MKNASKINAYWAALVGEGMQLELSCDIAGKRHIFGSFIADEADESLFLDLFIGGEVVRFPLDQLEALIAAAKKDVHSEAWYDRQDNGDA